MSRKKRSEVSKVNPFRLLFFRRRERLTRQELALAVGLTEKTIQRLECTRSVNAQIPRSLRDFESVSLDKLQLIEHKLKCAGCLAAGRDDDFSAELIDYYNQYRHVTGFANPSERYKLFGFLPKVIVFDFDGTLTLPTDKNTWERIWIELGYTKNDCGALAEQFFRKQISHETWCRLTLDRFRAKNLTEDQVRRVAKQVHLIEGVAETLKALKSSAIRLYIVSGSIRTIIDEVLGAEEGNFNGIEANTFTFDQKGIIDNIQGTQYDFEGKGRFVESIAKELGISTNDVLFVGNSINDVHVKRVGTRTLLVNPHLTHISDQNAWDDVILSMGNLTEILKFVGLSGSVTSGKADHLYDNHNRVVTMLNELDRISLNNYCIVGEHFRFDQGPREYLIKVWDRILASLKGKVNGPLNYLVGAEPGSGKSHFAEELIHFVNNGGLGVVGKGELLDLSWPLNPQDTSEKIRLKSLIDRAVRSKVPFLCVIDEIDAKGKEDWPYESIYKALDVMKNEDGRPPVVFILVGSGGSDPGKLASVIKNGFRGEDLIDRIPRDDGHLLSIPSMSYADNLCVLAARVLVATRKRGARIEYIERMAMLYAITKYFGRPRQLDALAVQAVGRMRDSILTYDHLFDPGEKENKNFWVLNSDKVSGVIGLS